MLGPRQALLPGLELVEPCRTVSIWHVAARSSRHTFICQSRLVQMLQACKPGCVMPVLYHLPQVPKVTSTPLCCVVPGCAMPVIHHHLSLLACLSPITCIWSNMPRCHHLPPFVHQAHCFLPVLAHSHTTCDVDPPSFYSPVIVTEGLLNPESAS